MVTTDPCAEVTHRRFFMACRLRTVLRRKDEGASPLHRQFSVSAKDDDHALAYAITPAQPNKPN